MLQADGFKDWRLGIDGMVARPGSFSLAELKALPSRSQITHQACEEGWSFIAEWVGVPLSLVLEHVGILPQARFVFSHGDSTDHGGKHKPGRRLAFGRILGPSQSRAADEAPIHPNGIRPVERNQPLGRRMYRERLAERDEPGIERAPGGGQRLLGFQHEREFDEIEATDVNERGGALLLRDFHGMCEGIAHFAQAHAAERWWQFEPELTCAQRHAIREGHF